jgi:hypothetical protein
MPNAQCPMPTPRGTSAPQHLAWPSSRWPHIFPLQRATSPTETKAYPHPSPRITAPCKGREVQKGPGSLSPLSAPNRNSYFTGPTLQLRQKSALRSDHQHRCVHLLQSHDRCHCNLARQLIHQALLLPLIAISPRAQKVQPALPPQGTSRRPNSTLQPRLRQTKTKHSIDQRLTHCQSQKKKDFPPPSPCWSI